MFVVGAAGTGPMTLGEAVGGFQTFAQAGVPNGGIVSYGASDTYNWEVGAAPYSSTGPSLARGPLFSSNGGAAVNLLLGAQVWITILAQDLQGGSNTSLTTNYSITTGNSGTQFDNYLASGAVIATLPPWAANLEYSFVVVTSQLFTVDSSGLDIIAIGAQTTGSVFSSQIYSAIVIRSTNSPGLWAVTSVTGNWSAA